MTPRAERNAGLIAVGLGAISFGVVSGLTTPDGGPDWLNIITCAAGALVLVIIGLFNVFHHGASA
jgi:hypothetical protein